MFHGQDLDRLQPHAPAGQAPHFICAHHNGRRVEEEVAAPVKVERAAAVDAVGVAVLKSRERLSVHGKESSVLCLPFRAFCQQPRKPTEHGSERARRRAAHASSLLAPADGPRVHVALAAEAGRVVVEDLRVVDDVHHLVLGLGGLHPYKQAVVPLKMWEIVLECVLHCYDAQTDGAVELELVGNVAAGAVRDDALAELERECKLFHALQTLNHVVGIG